VPGCQDFVERLKRHLLNRILGHEYDGDEHEYTTAQENQLVIAGSKIYRHKVLRINYTTYNMRCDQDSLKPHNHADFMVLANEDEGEYPYWYGRLTGIFHADISYTGPECASSEIRRMEFVWVCWFGRDLERGYREGWRARRLPRIGFVPHEDPGAFGFLDPALIIRGVHVIPAFAYGQTNNLLPMRSIARLPRDNNEDWAAYYVNM
jgi:hypothetical protein